MNLDDIKTGDRLWAMLLVPKEQDSLTSLAPQEIIYLSRYKHPGHDACFNVRRLYSNGWCDADEER